MKNKVNIYIVLIFMLIQLILNCPIVGQSIHYFKDINFLSLDGVNPLRVKEYPCIGIISIGDSIKNICFFKSIDNNYSITFEKKQNFWYCEDSYINPAGQIDSFFTYVFNNRVINFHYNDVMLAISIFKNDKESVTYILYKNIVQNREKFFDSIPIDECHIIKEFTYFLKEGTLNSKGINYRIVKKKKEAFYESNLYINIGKFSFSWWFWNPKNDFPAR